MEAIHSSTKGDLYWRLSRVAGGLLLRHQEGRLPASRRKTLRKILSRPGVSEYLIDQGMAYYVGKKAEKLRLVEAQS